jgi:hypothetical protein
VANTPIALSQDPHYTHAGLFLGDFLTMAPSCSAEHWQMTRVVARERPVLEKRSRSSGGSNRLTIVRATLNGMSGFWIASQAGHRPKWVDSGRLPDLQ